MRKDNEMKEETQYYRMFKLDNDMEVELNGKVVQLKKGYYRFNYFISGREPEHKFQHSLDRIKWEDIDICSELYEFDILNETVNDCVESVMSFAKLEYVETVCYRGYSIPVFYDDYGQSFFIVVDTKEIGLGTYNASYEDDIREMIDYRTKNDD